MNAGFLSVRGLHDQIQDGFSGLRVFLPKVPYCHEVAASGYLQPKCK